MKNNDNQILGLYSFLQMKFLVIVAALVAVASAQEQCSCAPQPITIQLSCGGNNIAPPQNPPEVGPVPTPEPVVVHPIDEEIVEPEEWKIQRDPECSNCRWKNDGAGNFYLHGDTNNGFYLSDFEALHDWTQLYVHDLYDRIDWSRKDAPKPSRDWDGSASALGFPMPDKDTNPDLYYSLLCWPLFDEVPAVEY